ncbi:hypothetical protein GDO78_022914 [Eleutherodactylus coqui]|uniref:Uncharacterized protein n=1 Tax=Eleutherodactylus coqui TaxID=57060 RepID=A0A8J6EFM5_ELECQ|nr:hypothetical protein GDO78_022914 [Eleutherodactylus coqui]
MLRVQLPLTLSMLENRGRVLAWVNHFSARTRYWVRKFLLGSPVLLLLGDRSKVTRLRVQVRGDVLRALSGYAHTSQMCCRISNQNSAGT